mgnify:CR=1 FL=1
MQNFYSQCNKPVDKSKLLCINSIGKIRSRPEWLVTQPALALRSIITIRRNTMIKFAEMLGRVMMTAVKLPRSTTLKEEGLRKFAETEYRKDSAYVYDCLIHNRKIDLR